MVHDPRVTQLLSRLGGLYRDPARVDRDASSLLKSSVGVHLVPGIAPLVENNGDSSHCLVLQGTIAIVFRGMTYQLLVDVFLPPGYPIRPPVSYVRLAPNMYIKERHPHVGSDGMVYLPYLHEWNSRSHSLIEMVVAMSSVFSADPPVFTRSTPAPAPPPPAAAAAAPAPASDPPPSYAEAGFNSGVKPKGVAESDRFMREQMEAIMAKEAEEANRAAEAARKAELEEKEREKQIAEQKKWEAKRLTQIKDQVNQKIYVHLSKMAVQTRTDVQSDWQDLQQLKQKKVSIDDEIDYLTKSKEELEQHIATADAKTAEIEQWLEESKAAKEDEEGTSVDDICQPVSKLHAQMFDLSAENAALSDALYFLDRAIYMGHVDCTTHLKSVRKLAKRQFLIKAHLIKINDILLKKSRR